MEIGLSIYHVMVLIPFLLYLETGQPQIWFTMFSFPLARAEESRGIQVMQQSSSRVYFKTTQRFWHVIRHQIIPLTSS